VPSAPADASAPRRPRSGAGALRPRPARRARRSSGLGRRAPLAGPAPF